MNRQRGPLRDEIRAAIEAETRPAHPALAARIREGLERRPAAGLRVPRLAAAIAVLVAVAVIAGMVATGRLVVPSPVPVRQPTPAPTAPDVVVTPPPAPATSAPAPSATPSPFECTTASTSGAATGPAGPKGVTTIRTGPQPGYDRFVIEFDGGVAQYRITPQAGSTFTQDASGRQLTLRGAAGLLVVLPNAKRGDVAYTGPTDLTPGLAEIQEARLTGDFEGTVSFGLGLTHPACYRVLLLTNPSRLVIDVQT
jgi:hypothetical protein